MGEKIQLSSFWQVEEQQVERKVDYRPMVITEITQEGKVYGQYLSDGQALEKIADNLERSFKANPPLPGAYNPRKGELLLKTAAHGQGYQEEYTK